jgi:hypothetical protein
VVNNLILLYHLTGSRNSRSFQPRGRRLGRQRGLPREYPTALCSVRGSCNFPQASFRGYAADIAGGKGEGRNDEDVDDVRAAQMVICLSRRLG